MTSLSRGLAVPIVMALLCACALQKAPAEKALAAAEAAYAEIAAEARSVAPDAANEMEAALANARTLFADADYADVSKLAPDLLARIESLGRTLPEQRAKLEADWRVLAESVPGALGALAKKLEDHGQPPAGMPDRAQFDSARSRLDAARAKWAEAEALTSTNLSKAVAMADEVRLEAVAALTEFGQRGS